MAPEKGKGKRMDYMAQVERLDSCKIKALSLM